MLSFGGPKAPPPPSSPGTPQGGRGLDADLPASHEDLELEFPGGKYPPSPPPENYWEWMSQADAFLAWVDALEKADIARLEEELEGLLAMAANLLGLFWSLRPEDGEGRKAAWGDIDKVLGGIATLHRLLGR